MPKGKIWYICAYAAGVAATLAMLALGIIFLVMPRMNWSATAKPGSLETRIARLVLVRWVALNATEASNPYPPNADGLASGRREFDEHCANCHGIDGSGRNRFEADFYPPAAKLTGDAQKLSDGEIYFIIAKGIRLSGMPGFAKEHSPAEIWRIILWTRHLARMSPDERKEIDREASQMEHEHQQMMKQGAMGGDSDVRH